MKTPPLLSSICLVFAIMFVLSVSVHPAMAAEALNDNLGGCPSCGNGIGALSSIPGLEGKKVPTVNIREISTAPQPFSFVSGVTGRSATVSGTKREHPNAMLTLDIQDPFSAVQQPLFASLMGSAAVEDTTARDLEMATTDSAVAAVVANMSRDGYEFTAVSSHRYESTVTSDDLLTLNSSQKAAMSAEGFTQLADDTVLAYRDTSFYTFTNRTTQSHVYLAAVQRLDTSGNPIGDRELALSPEFTAAGTPVVAASFASTSVSDVQPIPTPKSPGSKYCLWEWTKVVLLTVALVADIILIILGIVHGLTGEYAFLDILILIMMMVLSWILPGNFLSESNEVRGIMLAKSGLIVALVLLAILLLYYLILAICDLGICMGWWTSSDQFIWAYQYRFLEGDNGRTVPLALHDRFALVKFADTRVDPDAHWMVERLGPGLTIKDTITFATVNGTAQAWLVEATAAGSQEFTLKYMTSQPVPPTVVQTSYTLNLPVSPGHWAVTTIDDMDTSNATEKATSLAFDRTGVPHVSYYNTTNGRVMYASQAGTTWQRDPVAGSAGTYTTSLAFDKNGAPSISYGDGLHWGNLMFAQKNGTGWDTGIVAKGTGGDAGEYSSLAFDREGIPHIAYNDGQHYATLYYATLNQTSREWEFAMIDDNGVGGNTGFDSSLIIDAAGIPHVSYRDGNHYANLMYAVWDGVNWTSMKVDDGGGLTGNTGYSSSLVLDTTGNPHIAYYDAGNWALRYASWNGTGWYTETIDNRGNVGQYASLALDNQNRPHIGYYALSQHELRYATRATASDQWVIRTIDNNGVSGQYVKIALDSTGHPCFVYYETMNHALKFAGWTDG